MEQLKGFGINVVLDETALSNVDKIIGYLDELRVEYVRIEFDLNIKTKICYGIYDEFVYKCNSRNIKILGLLNRSMPGTLVNILFSGKNILQSVSFHPQEFLDFTRTVVTRYKDSITEWEIWNEENFRRFWPSSPNEMEYFKLLRDSHNLIKSICPKAQIVYGGIMGNDVEKLIPGQRLGFFKKTVELGALNYCDYIAFHPYILDCYFSLRNKTFYTNKLTRQVSDIQGLVGTKSIYFTEFGISSRWVSLKTSEVVEIYSYFYKLCVSKNINLFLWVLADPQCKTYEIGTPEKHFGLLNSDLTPKPIYQQLVKALNSL